MEFKNEALKPLTGKRLDEVMKIRGTDAENTILDLIAEDRTRVGVVFFLMSEDNVRKQVQLPWVSFGSDAVLDGAGGRVPEVLDAPARLRQLRALPGPLRARREAGAAAGGDPAADLAARRQPGPERTRHA